MSTQRRIALDSGAIIALSRQHRATIALLKVLRQEQTPLIIPAPVLAEVLRANQNDAPVHHVLNRYSDDIVPTSAKAARHAGTLLGSAGAAATLTIDALICATALEHNATDLLTADLRDYRRLLQGRLAVIPL